MRGDRTQLVAGVCRGSFIHFVRHFWECVPGAGHMVPNWHIELICREFQEAAEKVIAKQPRQYDLIFNVPFGSSKSTLVSILSTPWVWARMPQARFISGTHTDKLVLDLSAKSRAVIASEKYREHFPGIELVKDSEAYFTNNHGGDRLTCTIGGKTPTGFHADFILIDDPIDPQGARSEAELENAAKFMTEVIPSRKTDKDVSLTCLIMQRIHFRDPTAVMEDIAKQEGAVPVRKICLPGEFADNVSPPLEEIRERWPDAYEDGLLDPKRLSKRTLQTYKVTLGAYGYAGQVMQTPIPPGGGMFKREYFNQRIKAAPYHAKRVRYWDRASTASTQDQGCFTAGVLLAKDDNGYYVEHVVHGQWEPEERNRIIRSIALRDRTRYGPKHEPTIYVEAEGGSSGRDAWKQIARVLQGFAVYEDRPTGSKDVRAEPWAAQCAAHNVYLVDNGESQGNGKSEWDIDGYIEEHVLFRPEVGKRLGKYKDMVDASSGGFNKLIGAVSVDTKVRILTAGIRTPKNQVKFIATSRDGLGFLPIENRTLLVSLGNPSDDKLPGHAIDKLLDSIRLNFADIDPAECQDTWDDIIPPYDKPAGELLFTKEMGKKLWLFLLKKRDPAPDIYVFQDEGDRRALSVALAVADVMRLPRKVLWDGSDNTFDGVKAPNPHLYDMVKSTRGMVL